MVDHAPGLPGQMATLPRTKLRIQDCQIAILSRQVVLNVASNQVQIF
jgi:hypothetical protein